MTAVITKNSMRGISCNCSVPYAGHRRIYLFTPCHQAVDLCQRDGGVTSTEITPLPQLTFAEAQAKLRALLARLEFCNMQEYHRQRTRHASLDVKAYFNHVLERMDDKTKQALNPLFCSWHGAWVPVSVRILSVLQAKRQEYLQGLDLHVQYFLDLLLLSIALGELEVLAEPFYQYLKQLPRPIQDAISQKLPLVPNSTNVAQLYVDVKVLYAQFNCNGKSLFSGSHYLTVVDELIERCEATRSLTIYRASSGGCTPCLRSMMWEFLLQFWFVSMRGCDVRLETFFLAISLTDRYLAMQPVEKAELFAFACSGLYLASKCEEVGQLPLRRFVEYINHSVSIDRILMLEKEMATRLQFKMDSVTSYDVAMALIADQVPAATHTQMSLLQYILSVQALNTFYTEHNIATLGTAAYFLSCVTTGVPTGRPSSEVLRLMELTIASLKQVRPNEKIGGVVLKVFASKDYSGVSQMQFVPYCEEFINARSD